MSVYPIKNHDIDLYRFNDENFFYHETNFQVYSEFVSPHNYNIVVRRIDQPDRWDEDIQILVHNKIEDVAEIMKIGSSPVSEKKLSVFTSYIVEPDETPVDIIPRYSLIGIDDSKAISREEFNTLFNTDIVVLPTNLYATGIQNGKFYIYNESYQHFYNIIYSIKFIMRVAKSFTKYDNFYFIISACDGYFERIFWSENRTIPRFVEETECKDMFINFNVTDQEYPIYHKKKYILGQSNHLGLPYTIDIPDRHYLYHNYYNPFRSYHCGISFHLKQNKIVCGVQDSRGYVQNFISRRDIKISQRKYFKQEIVPRYSFIHCPDGWMDRKDQSMNYKYIIDITGNAACYDAISWKCNSNSVIFKTKSAWTQWFYDKFIPGIHYIEIEDDFSDIEEKYKWAEEHQDECLIMIENCKKLFQETYNIQNVFKYTIGVIEKINEE